MPKDKFYDSATGDNRHLEVSWRKQGHDVTVGAQYKLYADDDWHVTRVPLSARQLDDLIETLRRARRQSFGEVNIPKPKPESD